MKLSGKVIEETIIEIAGQDVVPLVKFLKNKKNVSEFKVAEAIKQEVNATRNMLYRLYNHNVVSFMRKKDKKKGWYIYYWTFDQKKLSYLIQKLRNTKLKKLKERLEREKQGQFFVCPNSCIRFDFDQAMNFQFKCPECGELMQQEDNTEKIKNIEEEIKILETKLYPKKKAVKKAFKKPKKKKKPVKKKIIKKSKKRKKR